MHLLIRMEDGNLYAQDLFVMAFDTRDEALDEMATQYQEYAAQKWAKGCHIELMDQCPFAFVHDERGCSYEWRAVAPRTKELRHITADEVSRAFDKGIITLVEAPGGGTGLAIAESWCFFGDDDAEELPPTEYVKRHSRDEICRLVEFSMGCYETTDPDDWWVYRTALDEGLS